MDFFADWLLSTWIGDHLRQAIADGYFSSGEDLVYFVKYVFMPLFSFNLLYLLPITGIFLFGCRFVITYLVDFLTERIGRIYCRLRYGKVVHLYPPEKEVK